MEEWLIGVVLAMLASFCAALGDNLVKYSFLQAKALELQGIEPLPVHKRRVWLAGIFCMVVLNSALNIASYSFADASITIPFGGLHIVFNIPLAKYLNHEHCSLRAVGFNGIILLGVMVVLITGNHDSEFFTANELWDNLFDAGFIVCTILLGGFVFFLTTVMFKSPKASHQRIGMVVFCGIIGSITQVWAKAMSECLKDGAWGNLFTWVTIGLTIFFALSQVHILNICLDRYAAFFVVPIVNSTIIVIGSLYAAIYFQEMDRWSIKSQIFVPFGIFLTSLGIGLLSTEPDEECDTQTEGLDMFVDPVSTTEPTSSRSDVVQSEDAASLSPILVPANTASEDYIRLEDVI